ncbi:MAG TPA: AAA family ATPase [Verrucomicrobiae bacterium]|jgi:general secretion pathway protein A|nr:AAA family ATPase [Verrucomicrobiae bacterium]
MAYHRLLKLEKEPFSTSPDPAFFYRSKHHRAALANLLIDLRLKRGLSVVLGDIGTGKTTLGRKLTQMLRERSGFIFHLILNPVYASEELFFDALCRRMGLQVASPHPTLVDYWEALEHALFQKGVQEKQTVVIIIDEAHKLTPSSLEALRVLLNYETNDTKLLQLILLGQMELLPLIQSMPNLNDRISLKYVLKPLSEEETRQMIDFRLKEAGYHSRSPLFHEGAIRAIHEYTGGYPRKISLLCHKALRTMILKGRGIVDLETIEDLTREEREIGWGPATTSPKNVYCV